MATDERCRLMACETLSGGVIEVMHDTAVNGGRLLLDRLHGDLEQLSVLLRAGQRLVLEKRGMQHDDKE